MANIGKLILKQLRSSFYITFLSQQICNTSLKYKLKMVSNIKLFFLSHERKVYGNRKLSPHQIRSDYKPLIRLERLLCLLQAREAKSNKLQLRALRPCGQLYPQLVVSSSFYILLIIQQILSFPIYYSQLLLLNTKLFHLFYRKGEKLFASSNLLHIKADKIISLL